MASLSASSSSRRSSSVSTGSNSMPGADTSASTFIGSQRSRNIVHLLRRSCARAGPLGVIAETLDTIIAFYRFPKGFAPQTSTRLRDHDPHAVGELCECRGLPPPHWHEYLGWHGSAGTAGGCGAAAQ